jgi:hypothetical protein
VAEALPAIREALRLRLHLTPYLYSAMHAAHEAHIPVLTPTFVLFEDDPACFTDADALMFGPSLLAAPVASPGSRAVEVYLPGGPECWRDFWTGAVYAPGQTVVVEAPLESLPLLAARGRDRRDHRRRERLFASARRTLARAARLPRRTLAAIERGHLRGRREYTRWAAHEGDDHAEMERGGGSGRRFRAGRL